MEKNISNFEKKALRKKAHLLKPVVMIGYQGLTVGVITEVDIALNAHELIKVRIRGVDKNKRDEYNFTMENKLNAQVVHQIGGITVLYRLKAVPS